MNPPLSSEFNLKKYIAIAAIFLIVGYGLFNARNIILGPSIEILSPQGMPQTEESLLTLRGRTSNITYLSLNNRPISIDTDGNFEEKLLLIPGFNIIRLYGRDRFRQETVKEINVYYKSNLNKE